MQENFNINLAPIISSGDGAIKSLESQEFDHLAERIANEQPDDPAIRHGRRGDSSPSARSILSLRERRDWTQSRVADMLRVDTRTIQNWEWGKSKMPWASWALLNVMAGMDVERLKLL